mmetsp:Transcript_5182/g.6355  ORF Transcript_5182/g.6355 Transcript_5182/m.6355 type:complete len:146 (+) Transcript_5182:1133-1570(+)
MESAPNLQALDGLDRIVEQVKNNKHNPVTATYYLLIKKYERNTDQNLVFGKFTRDKRLLDQQRLSEARKSDQEKQSTGSIKMIMPKNAGQSNSITVIQDSYGGLVSNESHGSAAINQRPAPHPKSEQKFRSQTQEAMINRNKNKL